MPTNKQLAQKIAAEKGIKYKSAMRYLQRAAAPVGKQRIAAPRFFGLSEETRKEAIRIVAAPAAPKEKPFRLEPPREKRPRMVVVTLTGKVELGSKGDIRERKVRQEIDANKILDADSLRDALDNFIDEVSYLENVVRFDDFRFDGKIIDENYWN